MQHLDEGTIHAWLDGALSADEAAGVERHVRECADCAALVAEARGVIAGVARIVSALDDVPVGVAPKSPPASQGRSVWRTLRLTPFRAAAAASLMVAAASLAVLGHESRQMLPTPMDSAAAASAAPPAAAPAQAAPAPVNGNTLPAAAPPSSAKSAAKGVLRAPAPVAAPVAPSAAAPPPALAEAKSAAPKSESRLESVARDSTRARDALASSPVADTARAAKGLADAVKREGVKPALNEAQATGAVVVGGVAGATPNDVRFRSAAAQTIAQPFRFLLTSADNNPLMLPGCYQLVRDTTRLSPLPARFSLESEGDAATQRNIVRTVTIDGKRDSVIAGVTWLATPGSTSGVVIKRDGSAVDVSRRALVPSPTTARVASAQAVGVVGQVNQIHCR